MPQQAILKDINSTDIAGAIRLGCQTMGNVFNADDNDIPFFGTEVGEKSGLWFNDNHSESHIPGRHLNALLTAEKTLGHEISEETIQKHTKAAYFSYSGPLPLPLNRDRIGGTLKRFLPHNLREGFHALYALTRYRNDTKAQSIAEQSIGFILKHWSVEGGWNQEVFEQAGVDIIEWSGPFISGIARAIGPLVKYYQVTTSANALELLTKLRDKALNEYFLEDGDFDWRRHGLHTHSVTCTMSSLAGLAEYTQDATLMMRVKAFFDNGLRRISNEIGWCIESAHPDANPDRGECNNTGDILETALILGKWGYTTYYQTAELITRAHLLPSQLRDVSFIVEPENPGNEDGKKNVAQRHVGAFGFPAPYGHRPLGVEHPSFNMDIVGGAVASLCEAQRCIHEYAANGHRVNLLFDYESEDIRISSPYTHGRLSVLIKKKGALHVRIPAWVRAEDLHIQGTLALPSLQNGYLVLPAPPVSQEIMIDFSLAKRNLVLKHRTRNIRVKLEGDQVTHMDNFGADLTFFEPY